MTTQSRISRQDKTRQFSQLWLLWRFWSSKSIKSQIEGRIFNFSPLTLIIVQWAVWTSLCGVSDAWVGGWWFYFATRFPLRLQILICSNCQELLHCKWPPIARKSLRSTLLLESSAKSEICCTQLFLMADGGYFFSTGISNFPENLKRFLSLFWWQHWFWFCPVGAWAWVEQEMSNCQNLSNITNNKISFSDF